MISVFAFYFLTTFVGTFGSVCLIILIFKIIVNKRKRIKKEYYGGREEIFKLSNYIKSHKLGEYLNDGFSYCDYCGKKLYDGEPHDTQKCLINKYNHVVIK